ncbi:TetR/AcrR family transcriptional regulator [Pseudooceanicola spongiae]|jgi:TetR/AcrR family transcriptional regulator, mexJK operon transcriptional repressor|uniref:TetR family transcriptional regulator n=1 Tax=Pseudooceanicola spongiae TaxID=2613965 RepID=A0A7L9WP38_9RHOB|nr:TetR/AcrR family transcriptional regulator [Pseudooceanicola spongiae]QOL81723.1 TetR family transcriptional regulator [Pseudooceanicola spongiae]|tara:strand:+ start:166 stop:792 length:627 start_codon:yes stop_codon:yes gene_type:complete
MNDLTPKVRKGRKYDQVLEGARQAFLQDGFDGAGVDDIARNAGVSKATLYSYFPDKRLLFIEIARLECHRQADEAERIMPQDLPVRDMLSFIATRMVTFFNSSLSLSIFRLCVAEAERFPDLAEEFYRNGPLLAQTKMSAYLREANENGELDVAHPELAANQFAELCKAGIFARLVFGIEKRIPQEELNFVASEAVEMFLARYGVKQV